MKRTILATALTAALLLAGADAGTGQEAGPEPTPAPITGFDHVVQYPVSGLVAEIVSATPDGHTLVYTDSGAVEVGFVDIHPADTPTELGTVAVDGSPTAVSVTPSGEFALVGVAGGVNELTVVDIATRARIADIALSGQPDSIAISANGRYAAVASGRNFTMYSATGPILFDSGAGLERAAADAGVYEDGRSDAKGTEPAGIEIGVFRGRPFLFVGMERADAVAVYKLVGADERPRLVEVLETGERPEGLLALPIRNLFVTANEDDGTIDIFRATP